MTPSNRKRPVSEMELSDHEDEESNLEINLEEQDIPVWTITYPKQPVGNSGQRLRKIWNGAKVHESPFHGKGQSKDALNLRYIIEPTAGWQAMRHYQKFVSE
jgi:hypothetical protein